MDWDAAARIAAGLGAVITVYMALRAALSADWAQKLVRLAPDPDRREGRTELRAIYGGMFGGLHLFVLGALIVGGPPALWASTAAASGWLGAALVRTAVMFPEGGATRYAAAGVVFEYVIAALLGAPLLAALLFA